MPTYQSAPFYPILFPDMVVASNAYGFQPLKGNKLVHAELNQSEHPEFKKYADSRVLSGLRANKMKDSELLKGPPSIKGNFAFTTHRGVKKLMSGGTVSTRQAEKSIQDLLRDRKFQLDALDQSTFEQSAPIQVQSQISEPELFTLDKLFSDLYSSLNDGVINSNEIRISESIISYFLTKADKIPDHKFADYLGILGQLQTLISDMFDRSRLDYVSDREFERDGAILRKLDNDVKLLMGYIQEFMNYLGEPSKLKAARLAAIRSRLLASRGKYTPSAQEVQRAREEQEREAMGQEDVFGNRGLLNAYGPGFVQQEAARLEPAARPRVTRPLRI